MRTPYSSEQPDSSPHSSSPLWMVSQAPALNALVVALQQARTQLEQGTSGGRLEFSRRAIAQARAEFSEMIVRGERELHLLAGLLADRFLGRHLLRSVVIGQVENTCERFTLIADVSRHDLTGSTDLDLGTRLLARLAIADERGWRRVGLVSNVIEYEPESPNPFAVYRILTRIKAEQEIWNKVTDEIFEIDAIVLRDKQLRHLGRYVKDVFGIKVVVGTLEDAYRLHEELNSFSFREDALSDLQIPLDATRRRLSFVEVKDYIRHPSRKQSGWSAIKSVISWGGRTFEIQVQPLSNFLHERERLSRESHQGFKAKRERVRDEVAARLPLFGFYRELLRWLLLDPSTEQPEHGGVEVRLID